MSGFSPAFGQDFLRGVAAETNRQGWCLMTGIGHSSTQEESELTGKITNAAKSANVPMVELTEQMPEQYDSLTAWMESLVDAFSQVIA